jgi:hypothetical protein
MADCRGELALVTRYPDLYVENILMRESGVENDESDNKTIAAASASISLSSAMTRLAAKPSICRTS